MKRFSFFASLICGFFILVFSIYGFILLRQRPGLPLELNIKSLIQNVEVKVKIDGIDIRKEKDIEFILSQKKVGQRLSFSLQTTEGIEEREIELVPYYSQTPFPLIYLIIGFFSFVISFLVFFLCPEDRRAHIFYWGTLAFAFSLIVSGGYYCLRGEILSYVPGILYYLLYPLTYAIFLHFSLTFTRKIRRGILNVVYAPALLFIIGLESTFLLSTLKSSMEIHRIYQSIFYVFRLYSIVFALTALLHFIICYKKATLDTVKAQLKWILYGLFVGSGPFLLLYQLPQVIQINPLISEDFSSLFFIFIPVGFAFSIIKFKLMNIELIIHRSLVYGTLTVFTVSLYIFSVFIFQNLFSKFFQVREAVISAIAALAAAAAFHPARKKIQDFVDKSFFRLSYDYRKTILSFNEKAQKMIRQDHLIDFLLIKIKKALPIEKIGFSLYAGSLGKSDLLSQRGDKSDLDDIDLAHLERRQILARRGSLQTEENIDFSGEKGLEGKGLELIIPLSFRNRALSGVLTLGKKKSMARYSRDDLELLITMGGELLLNLERIKLQEEVITERAEKEKLDELNRLKTEFISTVSHELRTPMSSIRGMTEVLQEGKVKDKVKQDEIIRLVASESSRLSRLLHNILDFGRIEQQEKTYNFQDTDICSVIEDVIKLFRYQLDKEEFVVRTFLPKAPLYLKVDQDAFKEALTNLIDNAIKYSVDKREIDVEVIEMEKDVEVQVRDKGIGIPLDDQKKIFDKFYRHPEATQHRPKGVGLGLKIVKHIIETHGGEIRVESQPNKGSTFSLILPKK